MKERGRNRMRVIDLLHKIANGEEVPEKFRFAGQIFEKQGSYIEDEDGDSIFDSMCTDFSNINEEVEVIEKDKKIKKLPANPNCIYATDGEMTLVVHKINEIIDYINKEDK